MFVCLNELKNWCRLAEPAVTQGTRCACQCHKLLDIASECSCVTSKSNTESMCCQLSMICSQLHTASVWEWQTYLEIGVTLQNGKYAAATWIGIRKNL